MRPTLGLILVTASAILLLGSCATQLHSAAEQNSVDRVQRLVEEGQPIDQRNHLGETPLMIATQEGNFETVTYLVEHGADVNAAKPGGGETPLRFAIDNNDYRMVEYFIEHGADVDQANQFGWTPFMTATRVGNKRILELLAESGADPYALTNDGEDAMTVASRNGHLDIVLMLALGRQEHYGRLLSGDAGGAEVGDGDDE